MVMKGIYMVLLVGSKMVIFRRWYDLRFSSADHVHNMVNDVKPVKLYLHVLILFFKTIT